MIKWIAKKAGKRMLNKHAKEGTKKTIGGVAGVIDVAMKWPLLIAVAAWNILDSILGIFISSPLWVFLILILLDALVNIILIIKIVNSRNIFKMWIWDIILFGCAAFSTLINILAGWWPFEWIIDPVSMVVVCFLVALIPFEKTGNDESIQYPEEVKYTESVPGRRTAVRRSDTSSVNTSATDGSQSGATIINIGCVSSNPLIKDDKE